MTEYYYCCTKGGNSHKIMYYFFEMSNAASLFEWQIRRSRCTINICSIYRLLPVNNPLIILLKIYKFLMIIFS